MTRTEAPLSTLTADELLDLDRSLRTLQAAVQHHVLARGKSLLPAIAESALEGPYGSPQEALIAKLASRTDDKRLPWVERYRNGRDLALVVWVQDSRLHSVAQETLFGALLEANVLASVLGGAR